MSSDWRQNANKRPRRNDSRGRDEERGRGPWSHSSAGRAPPRDHHRRHHGYHNNNDNDGGHNYVHHQGNQQQWSAAAGAHYGQVDHNRNFYTNRSGGGGRAGGGAGRGDWNRGNGNFQRERRGREGDHHHQKGRHLGSSEPAPVAHHPRPQRDYSSSHQRRGGALPASKPAAKDEASNVMHMEQKEESSAFATDEASTMVIEQKDAAEPKESKPWEEQTFEEKIAFLLKQDSLDGLPPVEIPTGFEDKQRHAVEETIKFVRSSPQAKRGHGAGSESGEDLDAEGYESDDSDFKIGRRYVDGKPIKESSDPAAEYLDFIQALPQCPLLDLGFHAVVLYPGMDKWCYCPCGKRMATWRQQFGLDQTNKPIRECQTRPNFAPRPLLDHLRAIGDMHHSIILRYLETLYEDWMGEGVKHVAFYNPGTKEYLNVVATENRKRRSLIDSLQAELNRRMLIEEKVQQQKKKMEELEKSNKDLHKSLEEIQNEKKTLQQELEYVVMPKVPVAEELMQRYMNRYRREVKLLRFEHVKAEKHAQSNNSIRIYIAEAKLNLQKCFDEWNNKSDEKDCTYLFREIDDSTCGKFLTSWDVVFDPKEHEAFKDMDQETRDTFVAVDDGGPTRVFVSEVWSQIGSLVGPLGVELFPYDDKTKRGSLLPEGDEKLNYKLRNNLDAIGVIRRFYRAIGRIMSYCLGQDDFPIADHVLPDVFKNYLLRGLSPVDDYPFSDLVDHVLDIQEKRRTGSTASSIDNFLGESAVAGCSAEEKRKIFREKVKAQFIDSREIALGALREGLTLQGSIDWSLCFGSIPLAALSQMVFAKNKVDAEDVIAVLKPKYDELFGNECVEIQKKVLQVVDEKGEKVVSGILPDILRDRAETDFVGSFVFFATGSRYVPHRNFEITVEFNFSEMEEQALPESHSCVKTLKLPGLAYEGNRERLEQKIDESIANTERGLEFAMNEGF